VERCGYDDPREALDAVIALLGDEGPVDGLMTTQRRLTLNSACMAAASTRRNGAPPCRCIQAAYCKGVRLPMPR